MDKNKLIIIYLSIALVIALCFNLMPSDSALSENGRTAQNYENSLNAWLYASIFRINQGLSEYKDNREYLNDALYSFSAYALLTDDERWNTLARELTKLTDENTFNKLTDEDIGIVCTFLKKTAPSTEFNYADLDTDLFLYMYESLRNILENL